MKQTTSGNKKTKGQSIASERTITVNTTNIIKLDKKNKNSQSKMKPVQLNREKSSKSRIFNDGDIFNETLKSINENLRILSVQIDDVRKELDGKITKLSDQVTEKNEKVNLDIQNSKLVEARIVPIVDELKKTVLEKEGLNERVKDIEQEKLISKSWMTVMFSVVSIVGSAITFYFERVLGLIR